MKNYRYNSITGRKYRENFELYAELNMCLGNKN